MNSPGVAWTNDAAWIEVDHLGTVMAINERFTADFGWTAQAIVGHPLLSLVPEHFRDAHNLGFARFAQFGKSNILGQPVILPLLAADGKAMMAETCIQAERRQGHWRFGAQCRLAGGQAGER